MVEASCDLNEELLKEQSEKYNIPKTYRVAVALLSELSAMNGGRIMDMPGFRKNMPREEQIIKL